MHKDLKKIISGMNTVVVMKFGSHLYGTNTPNSDEDYKGIYLPTKREIFLNKVPKSFQYNSGGGHSKNTKEDVDIELYSIHYFLELAFKGETIAIDMLHCNKENVIIGGDTWDFIRSNRSKFYTNNLKGFVGYCRKQAAKYGIKGSRISDARKVYNFLDKIVLEEILNKPSFTKMGEIWDKLPLGGHIHFLKAKAHGDQEEEFYQVCGKKMQKTANVSYCRALLKKFVDSYGHRALLAEKNQGIDWKAVSHAMRYAYQIKELFETDDIQFPLKQAEYLTKVKKGELDYLKEIAPKLESLMDDIELMSANTKLPSKVNRKFWESWLVDLIDSSLSTYL